MVLFIYNDVISKQSLPRRLYNFPNLILCEMMIGLTLNILKTIRKQILTCLLTNETKY